MPIETTIEDEGIYHQISGRTTCQDVKLAQRAGWNNPAWGDFNYIHLHFVEGATMIVTETLMMIAAAMDKASMWRSHPLLVAFSIEERAVTDTIRPYLDKLAMVEGVTINVFGDTESARSWITDTVNSFTPRPA